MHWFTTDPIADVDSHHGVFDAVIINACDSEGLVSAFNKAHMMANLLAKACPRRSLIVHVVGEDGAPSWDAGDAARSRAVGAVIPWAAIS